MTIPAPAWTWDGGQELWLCVDSGFVINLSEDLYELFRYRTPLVEVTYTHGYDEVPANVIAVVCSMAGRSATNPGPAAIGSQTIGPYSYRLSTAAQEGVLGLSDSEKLLLADYRRSSRTVELR